MFNLKNKRLIYPAAALLFIFFLSVIIIPAVRAVTLNIFDLPLALAALLKREVSGIVFYHRNITQNEKLKKEIDALKQKFSSAQEALLENERLKNLLSFKQKSQFKLVPARVIGRSADNWSALVIIDKGAQSGIVRNMPAVTHLGLAGKVIEVTKNTSKVMLINDPNLGVSSIVQRSRQEGLTCGTLGGYLIMKYLPKEADIKTGDVIITSGLTDAYPKGFLIGTVVDVGDEFSGLSKYAMIKPAINPASLEEVLIITQ